MINFDKLESQLDQLRMEYLGAKPFEHLVIEELCFDDQLDAAYNEIPVLTNKSRDLVFAEGKFEKSLYSTLGPNLEAFHDDIQSERFRKILAHITNKDIFVDPKNHGGGLHQGQGNSRLDMHLDYNYHPIQPNWWREVNLLFYMNKGWQENYGGHLDLRDLRTDDTMKLPVKWNSLIIQKCDDYTLHGYKQTNFPEGVYRTSIATYAFVEHARQIDRPRTTDWFVDAKKDGHFKAFLGRNIHHLIKVKSALFGSGTARNT